MRLFTRFFLFVFVVIFSPWVAAQSLYGRVVGVSDGDTITVLVEKEKRPVKVRLAEIDTPESRQPWGTKAKQALSRLVFGKNVRVEVQTTDRYGRAVAHVYRDDLWVNAKMVEEGHAWVYRHYSKNPTLLRLEAERAQQSVGSGAFLKANGRRHGSGDTAAKARAKKTSYQKSKAATNPTPAAPKPPVGKWQVVTRRCSITGNAVFCDSIGTETVFRASRFVGKADAACSPTDRLARKIGCGDKWLCRRPQSYKHDFESCRTRRCWQPETFPKRSIFCLFVQKMLCHQR